MKCLEGRKEMSDKVFVDTNIWVYAKIESRDISKHKNAILCLKGITAHVIISTQVVNEFYSALVKNKIKDPYIQKAIEQMIKEVEVLELSMRTIRKSWHIKLKYHFSIYDSPIIASALEAGCATLFTEDLQHKQLIENKLRIISPFIA